MANSELPGISDETIEMLEDHVKKGKARKFFMVYKGASIKTLGVFKKGPFNSRIMKAKKDGFKGEVVCGTIVGKGKNLLLQIPGNGQVAMAMKTDAFCEKAPTKIAKLREFLADNGLKLKPAYEIVHTVDKVVDPESDQPLALPELDALDATETSPEEAQPTASPSSDQATGPRTDEPAPAVDLLGQKLVDALKRVQPLMLSAIADDPTHKGPITQAVQRISAQIKAKEYDQAKQGLLNFVSDLKSMAKPRSVASETPTSDVPDDRRQEFSRQRDALEPKLRQAQQVDAAKAAKFSGVWDYANQQAAGGNIDKALVALDRLRQAVEASLASLSSAPATSEPATSEPATSEPATSEPATSESDTSEPATSESDSPEPMSDEDVELLIDDEDVTRGTVEFRKGLLIWNEAKASAHAQIEGVASKAVEMFPERAEAIRRLDSIMDDLDEDLSGQLTDCINADSMEDRRFHTERALEVVTAYLSLTSSHPVLQLADRNPFVSVSIAKTLSTGLNRLAEYLNSAAAASA